MKEHKQIKVAFIMVSITAIFIGTFFFGLHYLNLAARNDISNANADNTNLTEMPALDLEVPNQLIIIHTDQTVDIPRFGLEATLTSHTLSANNSLDTILTLEGNEIPSTPLHFTQIGETQTVGHYVVRIVSVTETAAQFVVQQQ